MPPVFRRPEPKKEVKAPSVPSLKAPPEMVRPPEEERPAVETPPAKVEVALVVEAKTRPVSTYSRPKSPRQSDSTA